MLGISLALPLASCDRGNPDETRAATIVSARPTLSADRPRPPTQAPLAGELVEIPGGAFRAGSLPGDPGRDPALEPQRFELELGPFRIDRLPFPNDPSKPPVTGVTREEAKKLCAEHGARLCTELEWERACAGPESDLFATGAKWHPRCSEDPSGCASGFDVLAMGALREWTLSDVLSEKGEPKFAAIRGAAASAPAPEHRCAQRRGIDESTKASDLGFRCCKGAPNAAVVPEPRLGETFEKFRLTAKRLQELFAKQPQTQSIAKDVKFFREPDAARTVVSRGPGDKKGFSFTVSPMIWNPSPGAKFLLVPGRSGERTSFVVAFHVLGKDRFRLAASFIMKNEPGPVAFAYSSYIRPRLHFSTCWGCPGETGKILFREPESVAILQP